MYGQKYKFAEMRTREDFVKGHPLTTYDNIKGYIERIIKGEENIFYPGPTVAIALTTGTTKEPKLYLYCKDFLKDFQFSHVDMLNTSLVNLMNLQRYAVFNVPSSPFTGKTVGNFLVGPATVFLSKPVSHGLVPSQYHRLQSEEAAYYTQAFFMLAEREIRYLSVFSADLMYSYMKFITLHWDTICKDIARGQFAKSVQMPDDFRTELSRHLHADPTRASELKLAMKEGTVGLIKRTWPGIEFIIMGKSASFKISANALQENHLRGVKLIDPFHPSTEGLTGFNLEGPQAHTDNIFTAILFSEHFVEFIPLENIDDENPTTLFPDEVNLHIFCYGYHLH